MSRLYRHMDQALCERAAILSRCGHLPETVAEIIGISAATVRRARRRGWRPGHVGHPFRPRPTDFAIQSRRMGTTALCSHYGCSTRTVTRWLREIRG